jgi:hypothetical protein
VRCTERTIPLFRNAWPDALPKQSQALETAVRLAERSASNAVAAAGLREAVVDAVTTAGEVLSAAFKQRSDAEPSPNGEAACRISFSAARAAASAAEAAMNGPEDSVRATSDSFGSACQAAESAKLPEIASALKQDIEVLIRLAKQKHWTDATPVAPSVFPRPAEKPRRRPWWKFW